MKDMTTITQKMLQYTVNFTDDSVYVLHGNKEELVSIDTEKSQPCEVCQQSCMMNDIYDDAEWQVRS